MPWPNKALPRPFESFHETLEHVSLHHEPNEIEDYSVSFPTELKLLFSMSVYKCTYSWYSSIRITHHLDKSSNKITRHVWPLPTDEELSTVFSSYELLITRQFSFRIFLAGSVRRQRTSGGARWLAWTPKHLTTRVQAKLRDNISAARSNLANDEYKFVPAVFDSTAKGSSKRGSDDWVEKPSR